MSLAPIVLFTYNRLHHTTQTIKALKKNFLADKSNLIIFSDGPIDNPNKKSVEAVREYIQNITGFKSVEIVKRKENFGLAKSIIDGVTEVVNKYGKVIVIEDDIVTSKYFLQYMNKGLDSYEQEDKVISINAYFYPVENTDQLTDTFFLKGTDCWGWATWKRGWDLFEADGKKLMHEIRQKKLGREFDGYCGFTNMLADQIKGKNDSWAIRWHASAFLKEKLSLFPAHSLVLNIGHDTSGRHSASTDVFGKELLDTPIKITKIDIRENISAKLAQQKFFKKIYPSFLKKIKNKLTSTFSS